MSYKNVIPTELIPGVGADARDVVAGRAGGGGAGDAPARRRGAAPAALLQAASQLLLRGLRQHGPDQLRR